MRNPELQYFIVVAEELNITKASKRLFISQQSLSTYLSRLEKYYGVLLLERKPRLRLTYAGECLLSAARQIDEVNNRLHQILLEIRNEVRGKVSLGVPRPRSEIILPDLLLRYKTDFPDVEFRLIEKNTPELAEMALNNQLDLFIGFEPILSNEFHRIPLLYDTLFLVVSNDILQERFKDNCLRCIQDFKQGVDLSLFRDITFILPSEGSSIRTRIDNYLHDHNIRFEKVIQSSVGSLNIELCIRNMGVGICSEMSKEQVLKNILAYPTHNEIHFFPINSIEPSSIVLAYRKNQYRPAYIDALIKYICDVFPDQAG